MEKCEVIKYMKSVDDGNLPIYGVASISLKLISYGDYYCMYIKSVNGPINVSSRVPILPYNQQTKVTTFTINSGAAQYFTIYESDIPSTDYLENIVEIDNMYNCSCFIVYNQGIYIQAANKKVTLRNNLKAMWKYTPTEIAGISADDLGVDFPDSLYYLSIGKINSDYIDLSQYLEMPNIESIVGGLGNTGAIFVDLKESNRHSNVIMLGASYKSGSKVEHLPYKLEFSFCAGLVGNVEDYVNMARSKGREEGTLILRGLQYVDKRLLYQGNSVKDLWNNNTIPHVSVPNGNVAILSWTQSTMTWLDELPEGALYTPLTPSQWKAKYHA